MSEEVTSTDEPMALGFRDDRTGYMLRLRIGLVNDLGLHDRGTRLDHLWQSSLRRVD